MKITFAFALFAIAIPKSVPACRSIEDLDNCALEISLLKNPNRKVPTNDAEAVAMCGNIKSGLECLKDDFAKCQKGIQKTAYAQIGNIILDDLEAHLSTRCDSEPHRADFIQHVSCFTNQKAVDAVRLCAHKYMVMLDRVVTKPKELQLPGCCCVNHLMMDCVNGQIKSLCTGQTGDYFSDIIQEETETNIKNFCTEYPDLAQCDAKFDATFWTELKNIQASTDAVAAKKHEYKTVIPVVMKMKI